MNEEGRSITAAIQRLDSLDPDERTRSRETLEDIGRPATWHLVQALRPTGERARAGALKVLGRLADPDAADALVERLEDEDSGCRWLAAEGLVALGAVGLARALDILAVYPRTDWLLRGAHHVLRGLEQTELAELVAPVLRSFQSTTPGVDIPAAALAARTRLATSIPQP